MIARGDIAPRIAANGAVVPLNLGGTERTYVGLITGAASLGIVNAPANVLFS